MRHPSFESAKKHLRQLAALVERKQLGFTDAVLYFSLVLDQLSLPPEDLFDLESESWMDSWDETKNEDECDEIEKLGMECIYPRLPQCVILSKTLSGISEGTSSARLKYLNDQDLLVKLITAMIVHPPEEEINQELLSEAIAKLSPETVLKTWGLTPPLQEEELKEKIKDWRFLAELLLEKREEDLQFPDWDHPIYVARGPWSEIYKNQVSRYLWDHYTTEIDAENFFVEAIKQRPSSIDIDWAVSCLLEEEIKELIPLQEDGSSLKEALETRLKELEEEEIL